MSKNKKFKAATDPSAKYTSVSVAKVLSDVADKAFALYKQQKQDEWIKEQRAAGHQVMMSDQGYLISVDLIESYKI